MQSRQIGFWQTTQFAAPGESGCFAHISKAGGASGASVIGGAGGASRGGAAGCDPATRMVLVPGAGGATFMGPPVATTGLAALGTGAAAGAVIPSCRAIISFAASVVSFEQEGQFTGDGIFPPIGSISKANFVPQSHRILMVMVGWV
jgi:hypothetical protein